MPVPPDPFSRAWRFNALRSKLSTQSPRSWIQQILANLDDVPVREHIIRADGSETVVSLKAKFDGKDHPVEGSPAADTVAYTRVDRNTISGTGKKNGIVSLIEALTVDPENTTLTLSYALYAGPEIIANGTALFEKDS